MGSKATPVAIARVLAREAGSCGFRAPVAHVYNPLDYAFDAHRQYLERHCRREADILLVGMNPGPWGPSPSRPITLSNLQRADAWRDASLVYCL